MMSAPSCIIVMSGKRKSGKDFLASRFSEKFGNDSCEVLHLSGPLKKQYAEEHGLDYEELLKSSAYKETYRSDMIRWGEDKRNSEPYFFCEKTVEAADPSRSIWIVADARRPTDLQYFREKYNDQAMFVRVTASVSTRTNRGFIFTTGVDDVESECALDHIQDWDFIIQNEGEEEDVEQKITDIVNSVKCKLK